ncbi:uncharacterized protein MONOS_6543 [Monocercomonoides exilis]|uniref:uncharacterized protein n=1 Tax=Monocercomonoides exilis TaxID=2049356 RepID=UPI003559D748|nr:hypothetical protein MONOS_6543 [Monocercomonoides exilis]|eukprot:MONOS_6543.1-p1 / transcript=MONOS_6543.1 / gene=MONOS_6543 / organism=Monocercomonoides_exilis_PA203 / gene_product=unspecified product / transcript_product=unspecified product / location=Mono_scaffold00207:72726-73445(-) / protein_length=240 / sequence_SO=supercontig / SO=protein_coding / is_pseudo=false
MSHSGSPCEDPWGTPGVENVAPFIDLTMIPGGIQHHLKIKSSVETSSIDPTDPNLTFPESLLAEFYKDCTIQYRSVIDLAAPPHLGSISLGITKKGPRSNTSPIPQSKYSATAPLLPSSFSSSISLAKTSMSTPKHSFLSVTTQPSLHGTSTGRDGTFSASPQRRLDSETSPYSSWRKQQRDKIESQRAITMKLNQEATLMNEEAMKLQKKLEALQMMVDSTLDQADQLARSQKRSKRK